MRFLSPEITIKVYENSGHGIEDPHTGLAWFMQAYSLINWEGAIKLGVQNESFSGDAAERALANAGRGIALPI